MMDMIMIYNGKKYVTTDLKKPYIYIYSRELGNI